MTTFRAQAKERGRQCAYLTDEASGRTHAAMKILGHRGASRDAAENTLEAFWLALRQGADGVELDVRLCGSGEVVVAHDDNLKRVSGVDVAVSRASLERVRSVDVGSNLGHSRAGVPLLEEVLAELPASVVVNVELKADRGTGVALVRAVADCLKRSGAEDRVVLSSFSSLALWHVRRLMPGLRRGYLVDPQKNFLLHGHLLGRLASNFSVHPHHSLATPEEVARWKAGGLKVAVWTVDDPDEARHFEALGVDYLITNVPGRVRNPTPG